MNEQASSCLVCFACGRSTPHVRKFSKNGCDISACSECGLGRAETASFDPSAYYTSSYFSGGHPDGYGDYLGAEAVLRQEFASSVDFIKSYRSSGKLVELGCAYGFFLQMAKRHFDVAGIELAADASAYCRNHGLNVITGIADAPTLSAIGDADIFVLLDVIEHLPTPYDTLSLCVNHLKPGGIIVLTTGDFASLLARWTGPSWRLMTPPQHLWFFTPESMRRMSSRLGLSVASLSHPWKLVPMSLIVFQLRRMLGFSPRKAETGVGFGVPVNLFDAMRVVLRKT